MQETALPHLLQHCHALAWHTLPPRQPMDVERWSEAWADALAQLNEFASHGYYGLDVPDLPTEQQHQAWQEWQQAARQSVRLLELAYQRGLPPTDLETLFGHVLHWCNDYAQTLRQAADADATPPALLDVAGADYPAAVLLVALPVLLERQELIPGIIQRLLGERCDRLLDYLSAAACDKSEAVEQVFRPVPYAALTPFFEQLEVTAAPLLHYLQQAYPASQDSGCAWEAGALVVLYGLDDSAFRDHPHYPAQLVDFARQRLQASYPESLRA